jgi:hypothetical protein
MCILVKPTHAGPAHRRAKEIDDLAENEVLDEMQAVLGGRPTQGFEAQFRNGASGKPRSRISWKRPICPASRTVVLISAIDSRANHRRFR